MISGKVVKYIYENEHDSEPLTSALNNFVDTIINSTPTEKHNDGTTMYKEKVSYKKHETIPDTMRKFVISNFCEYEYIVNPIKYNTIEFKIDSKFLTKSSNHKINLNNIKCNIPTDELVSIKFYANEKNKRQYCISTVFPENINNNMFSLFDNDVSLPCDYCRFSDFYVVAYYDNSVELDDNYSLTFDMIKYNRNNYSNMENIIIPLKGKNEYTETSEKQNEFILVNYLASIRYACDELINKEQLEQIQNARGKFKQTETIISMRQFLKELGKEDIFKKMEKEKAIQKRKERKKLKEKLEGKSKEEIKKEKRERRRQKKQEKRKKDTQFDF